MAYHIAFVKPSLFAAIVDGRKTVESRFSVRAHPARKTLPGDILIFRCNGKNAIASVTRVEALSGLSDDDMTDIRAKHGAAIAGDVDLSEYWQAKAGNTFAVLIWFSPPQPIIIPHKLPSNQLGWVSNYCPPNGVLSGIPYSQGALTIESSTDVLETGG